jgi:ABC-type sulfate transport system substrate-binding protein
MVAGMDQITVKTQHRGVDAQSRAIALGLHGVAYDIDKQLLRPPSPLYLLG